MAFLVEHISLNPSQNRHDSSVPGEPLSSARPPKSGAMKIFRRASSNVKITDDQPAEGRKPSVVESRKKSSFAAIPSRLRRRKTKTSSEQQEGISESAARLGQLFFGLPPEILTEVICYLSLTDIYSLRKSSPSFCSILNHNASVISRYMLSVSLPEHAAENALTLYPVPPDSDDLSHLLRMLHRQKRIDKTIFNTMRVVQMKMYAINSQVFTSIAARGSAAWQHLERCLQRPVWTVYHFFESYRNIVVDEHDEEHKDTSGRFWDCKACELKAQELVNSYAVKDVLPAYHFLQLLMLHYRAATRPPNLSPLERKNKAKKSTSEDLSLFALLGGIEEMSKINMMQGSYTKRMQIINKFVTKVRTAADINQASMRTSGLAQQISTRASSSNISELEDHSQQHNSQRRRTADVTKSLCPAYSDLTQDHLDRIPTLQDFLLPIWRDRIERENFAERAEDLDLPFEWAQRILLQEANAASGSDDANGMDGHTGNQNQDQDQDQDQNENGQQQNQTATTTVQAVPLLFASHAPSNLVPIFGASPV